MSKQYSAIVKTAQEYYNSDDADNFYFHIWGGEDIHVGIYQSADEDIAIASQRTIATMLNQLISGMLKPFHSRSRVVDIGAGYGGAARQLARAYECNVTCVNLSEAQNERNRTLSEAAGLAKKIDVLDANFEDIPCNDEYFDLAWSQDAILHTDRRDRVLDEVDRVLKPGGEFIFTDPMQADNCPEGVLQPVLDRIHLSSLGSFSFYRQQAKRLGWEEIKVKDLTPHLVCHYSRVREELVERREELSEKVSSEYIDRMIQGLGHWVEAGEKGYLAWGIMHFRKPEPR